MNVRFLISEDVFIPIESSKTEQIVFGKVEI